MFNEVRSIARKYGAKIVAGSAALSASALALADGSDPFTTTLATVTTNVGTYVAGLGALAAVGVAAFVGIKYVRKIIKSA